MFTEDRLKADSGKLYDQLKVQREILKELKELKEVALLISQRLLEMQSKKTDQLHKEKRNS